MSEETCYWKYEDMDCFYETACGVTWSFVDGGIEENGVNFCHSCGKKVISDADYDDIEEQA